MRICSRSAVVDRSVLDEEKRTIRTVVTTENPAIVIDWSRWEVIREVLLMDGAMLPGEKKIPLLDNHRRGGEVAATIKGSVRELTVEGNELVGISHFSSLAEKEWTLATEGHLDSVSAGYETFEEESIEVKKGKEVEINGKVFRNDYQDGLPFLIRKRWRALECSLVPIGADEAAKFRSMMNLNEEKRQNEQFQTITEKRAMNEQEEKKVNPDELIKMERERISEITAYAERFAGKLNGGKEKAGEAIRENWSADKFRNWVLDNIDTSGPVETPVTHLGLSDKEIKQFSVSRAILMQADDRWERENCFEREASEAVAKNLGETLGKRTFFIPFDVVMRGRGLRSGGRNIRASNITPNDAGGYLVGTDHLGSEFIDILRNTSVLNQAGVRTLSGLRGNIQIPKQTGSATFQWVGTGAADQSQISFTQVEASMKRGSATTEYGRDLLIQGDPSVDDLINVDLFSIAALGTDRAGLYGTGIGNEPKGLMNETGVGTVDGAGLTWAKVVDFSKQVKQNNAMIGEMKWLMSPEVEALLLTRTKAGDYPVYLMEGNKLNGHTGLVSNQVESSDLIVGVWNQLMKLEWGTYEVLVNPYGVNSRAGMIETTIFVRCNYITRQSAAFTASNNVS